MTFNSDTDWVERMKRPDHYIYCHACKQQIWDFEKLLQHLSAEHDINLFYKPQPENIGIGVSDVMEFGDSVG